jgi:hypothetical protein
MPVLSTLGNISSKGFGSAGSRGPTTIGEFWQGGYYAGQISFGGNTYYLLVAPLATGGSQKQFGTSNFVSSLGLSTYDGATNTAELDSASYPAAQWASALTINGYSDWYLPALYELEICYYNLKPTASSNNTSVGSNPYAVPARGSNYTTGSPARTSVAAFQSGGSEAFATAINAGRTWSSTNTSSASTQARRIEFDTGLQFSNDKTANYYVRAIRKVLI